MNKTIQLILSLAIVTASATSCNEDKGIEYGNFRNDMVTFMHTDNGRAVFSLLQHNDTDEITLITADSCKLGLKRGQRLLLNYIPEGDMGTGVQSITPKGYTKAITDSLRYTDHNSVNAITMDSIRLKSIWRTGNYINLSSELKYTRQSRQISLVMDKSTWHSDTVHCYLMHNMMQEQAYFWRKCYCSFYIGAVWKLSSCRTVRVHLKDVVYTDKTYYDFSKN